MSQFNPTSRTILPPPDADAAGQALLKSLGRPLGPRLSWSVVKSLILSVITFGVVPIFVWVRTFAIFAVSEQQQLLQLARWLRATSSHPLARRLEEDAAQLRPRKWISWLAIVGVLAVTAAMFNIVEHAKIPPGHHDNALLLGTYGFGRPNIGDYAARHFPEARRIFLIWIWGLSAVYAAHLLQVHLHAQDIRRFVRRFNEIAAGEGLHKVTASERHVPIGLSWVAAGLLMAVLRAPWGVAAMLAGGAHRRYITRMSRDTRAELAHRVRAMMIRRGAQAVVVHGPGSPAVPTALAQAAPVPVYLRQRCIRASCRAELPPDANYCRRCGARQKPQVDKVA